MDCFNHQRTPAAAVCSICGKGVCRACIGRDAPRVVCKPCVDRRPVIGFEYRSRTTVFGWPLVHVCGGVDATTGLPKVARGVIAVGSVAIGVVSFGGVALGVVALGGLAMGLLLAVGGAALGLGLSLGGLAVGTVAVGGMAVGAKLAIGGGAAGGAVIGSGRCDPEAVSLLREWLGMGPPPGCPR